MAVSQADSEFFYTIQSNASLDLFPRNSCSNFYVRLPEQRCLPGEWMVALAEISFPTEFVCELRPEIVLLLDNESMTNIKKPKIAPPPSPPPKSNRNILTLTNRTRGIKREALRGASISEPSNINVS